MFQVGSKLYEVESKKSDRIYSVIASYIVT